MKVLLVKGLLRIFSWLPLSLTHAAGKMTGFLLFHSSSGLKRTTLRNLEVCLPDKSAEQIRKLAKQSLQETAKTGLEMGIVWYSPVDRLMRKVVKVTGEDLFVRAREQGRGIIVVGPHLGNWELMGLYLSTIAPITSFYQPPREQAFESLIKDSRSRGGASLVATNRQGIASLVKALKKQEMVGILPDQEPKIDHGVFAPFFGVEALTMTLVSRLAGKTGAAVLFAFAKRLDKGAGYEVIFKPACEGIDSPDLHVATSALNRSVENCVAEALTQYQWEYKRFKRRPSGENSFYGKRAR